MCAPSELQFGALREGGGTREAESTVVESLVVLYRVGTHQIRRRRRAARSSTSQGRAEPLCARESKALTGRFLREKLMSDHGRFLPTRATRSGERGMIRGGFSRMHRALDAGSRAGFTGSRPPPSWTSVFQFPYFCTICVALRNLDLLIKTGWSVICPLCC